MLRKILPFPAKSYQSLSRFAFSKLNSSKLFEILSAASAKQKKKQCQNKIPLHLSNGKKKLTIDDFLNSTTEEYPWSLSDAMQTNANTSEKSNPPNNSSNNNATENNSNSSNTSNNNFFNNNPPKTPKLKKRSKEKLETTSLANVKFELLPEEEGKKQSKYILFSSKYPILPHIKIEGMFSTGKLAAEELKHPIAFVLQNDEGQLYTTGVIFKKNINKKIKEHIDQKPKTSHSSNPFKSSFSDVNMAESSIKSEICTKKTNYRIKITEIEMNSNGIFVKAYKLKDKAIKEPVKIKEELQNLLDQINELKKMDFVGKPQLFDDQVTEKLKGIHLKTISVDEVDEILYNISTIFFKTEFYLSQKPNLLYQELLETRDLLQRVNFIRSKINDLLLNFQYQTKISNIVSADKTQQKIFNKGKNFLAGEYIKTVFGINDQNFMNSAQGYGLSGGSAANKFIKTYLDKLHLIKDIPSQEKVKKEIERLASMDKHSPEHSKILTYLDEVFSIPWNKATEQYWNIRQTKDILEKNIYGLQKVKERIIEMIAVNKLKGETKRTKGFIILLYGPPGTGKTSVAKSIAKAIKRPYRFISFAGVNDPHFIKGHGRTYVDSQPGMIL